MKRGVFAILLLVSASACVRKSELDQAQQENKNLTSQMAQLQQDNKELRSQLGQVQQQMTDLEARLQQTKSNLSAAEIVLARKPDLPVKVTFRRALMGPGFVAILNTTIKQDLPVLVTIKSKALGTTQQFSLHLSQAVQSELGHAQGAAIDNGDEISVTNTGYEPLTLIFSPS